MNRDIIWKLAFCARAYKHRTVFFLPLFCVCVAPREPPVGVPHLLTVIVPPIKCLYTALFTLALFLVSPLYFSTPSRVTLDHPSCTLFPRYAYKLLHGFWEMDGLSRCACCLVVNTLLFRVGCLFQRLIESSGRGSCATEGCALTASSVTRFILETANGEGKRVGG